MNSKVAVVTGSNKGIGYEIVKELCKRYDGVVYLTARDQERGRAAVKKLNDQNLHPKFHQLDVTSRKQVQQFADFITAQHGGIDILVNNAGVLDFVNPVCGYEDACKLMDTNYKSILTLADILYPLLRQDARVINMSSDWGLLSNVRKQEWLDKLVKYDLTIGEINEFVETYLELVKDGKSQSFAGGYGDYKVSKVALSALTFVHQREFNKGTKNIAINCTNPGFVKTDMTLGMGDLTTEQGARSTLYLALDAPQTMKGCFIWEDCSLINWGD